MQPPETRTEKRGLLAGMVLGDAYMGRHKAAINPHIALIHPLAQKDYLLWKLEMLQPLFHYPLKEAVRFRTVKVGAKRYKTCAFHSRVEPELKTVWKTAYRGGRKRITRELLEMLTPLGLAVWYMDDGSCNDSTAMLSTYCSRAEAETCVRYFKERWGIGWRLWRHKSGFCPMKGTKSPDMNRFKALIEPFVIPSMEYKIRAIAPAIDQVVNECRICGADTSKRRGGYCEKCYYRRYETKDPAFRKSMMI